MITKKCRDCGKEFTLTDGEIEFYRSKGFELPTRCKSCRDKRKGRKPSSSPQNHNSNKSSRSRLPIFAVIIATALLAALFFKLSDILIPEQASPSEITETSAYITEQTPPAITSSAITSDTITSETSHISTSSEAIVTGPEKQGLCFRNADLLEDHYEKHGIEMGFSSPQEYERAAAAVVSSPDALHKLEKEDNDDVYYLESTNEFVIVSTDGYIRTYFKPNDGKDYFDRQ